MEKLDPNIYARKGVKDTNDETGYVTSRQGDRGKTGHEALVIPIAPTDPALRHEQRGGHKRGSSSKKKSRKKGNLKGIKGAEGAVR